MSVAWLTVSFACVAIATRPEQQHSVGKLSAGQLTTGRSASADSFDVLGDHVALLPVSNVGVAELHAVQLGLTKEGMPCHQQKTLKPSAKVLATITQCKTPAKARVTNVLDENRPHLLSFVV